MLHNIEMCKESLARNEVRERSGVSSGGDRVVRSGGGGRRLSCRTNAQLSCKTSDSGGGGDTTHCYHTSYYYNRSGRV